MTIYKYPIINVDDVVTLEMPDGAQVLHVGEQLGLICIWALVNPYAQIAPRTFAIRGTGHPVGSGLTYLGTAHINPFVWHIFE